MITSFEATFERYGVKRDGVATLEFKIPTADLAKAMQTVIAIEQKIRVVAIVIEKADIIFEIKEAAFERLSVYREGNSRVRFETLASNINGLDNIEKFVEMNLKVEIYKLEEK